MDKTTTGLPKPPGRNLRAEEMYAYLASFTDRDWAHAAIYLYRLYPVIERKPKSIDQLAGPFDEQYLLKRHGSGVYEVWVNDFDLHGAHCNICKSKITLNNLDHPPILNLAELNIGHPTNKGYVDQLVREGKLNQQGQVIVTAQKPESGESTSVLAQALVDMAQKFAGKSGGSDGRTDDAAFNRALDMVGTAGQKSIEMALAQVRQSDPDSFLKLLLSAKELFNSGGNDGLVKVMGAQLDSLRSELAEERKANRELLIRLLDGDKKNAGGGGSPLAQLKELLEIQDLLGGRNGNGPRNWKEMLIVQGLPHLEGMLKEVTGALRAAPAPSAVAPQVNPAREHSMPSQQQPPAATGPATPVQELQQILRQYGNFMLNAFGGGATGDGFADSVVTFAGLPTYQRLANFDAPTWLQAINGIPELATHFQGLQPQLAEFVEAFLAFGHPETEEPPEPPAAVPLRPEVVKKKKQ